MAEAVGIGLDLSKIEATLKRIQKEFDATVKKGENLNAVIEKMITGADWSKTETSLKKLQDTIEAVSKSKDPMKWDSKGLKHYIDQANILLRTMERMNEVNGGKTPLFDTTSIKQAIKDFKEMQPLVKSLESALKDRTTARNQTYKGALRYSDNANTLEKERQAIVNLEAARDKLKQTDADYANKLNNLNVAIEKHKKHIKEATKTDTQRAAEAQRNADKIVQAERRAYEERSRLARQQNQKRLGTYEGAMDFAKTANTLNRMQKALAYLNEARNKESLTTAESRRRYRELTDEINRQEKAYNRLSGVQNGVLGMTGRLGRGLATLFGLQQIQGYINKMIQVRGEFELQQRSLQAILQNKDEANEIWQKTVDLAVKSPFRVKELVTYTKQLAAYRVESEKLFETNKMLADVSAGLGVDMNRLILAFGQVKAANFLRGTELRQFTEAGIPMLDELAKLYSEMEDKTVSSAEVFDRISKRMVLFEDVEEVFKRMTSAGGTFYQMQEKQSETLKGQISNLKDSIDIMLNDIGKANEGITKTSVKAVKLLVDNYEKFGVVLKSVITLLAVYKLNSLLAARSAHSMVVQMRALRIAFARFSDVMTKNPWTLWLTAILAVGNEIRKVVKQFREVNKTYDEMLNRQSQVSAKVIKSLDREDYDEARKSLQELINLANEEYDLKIDVDIKGLKDDEIRAQFDTIRQQMIDANAFAAEFQKELIEANLKTKWNFEDWNKVGIFEQGMNKDIDQMGDAYDNLNRIMVNKLSPTIEALDAKWADLSDEQKDAYWSLSEDIRSDEDLVDYFDRIRESYKLLLESNAIEDRKLTRQLRRYSRRMEEAKEEFDVFINGIDETVMSKSDEEKTLFLNAAIDDAKAEKNWSEFEETQIRKWLEKKYEIELTPKITEDSKELKAWQNSYNSLFTGKEGFRKITQQAATQKQVIDRLNGSYEATKELIDAIERAGEDSILEGGAYEGQDLAELKHDLAEIKEQLDWFGAKAKDDDAKESASVKILQKRINLLKEVNKKYLELEKTFGAVAAKEKVMDAYADTFSETFKGTGVNLDMYQVMTQVITDSKKVGEEMGSNLSEGVVNKLKELEAAGTYIRNYSQDLIEFTKANEEFRAEAYDDRHPKRKLKKGDTIHGTLTIGYGTTNRAGLGEVVHIGDIIDEAKAEEYLIKTYDLKVQGLNKILDANRELIITQEQYNALLDSFYQGEAGTKKAIDLALGEWQSVEAYINSIKDLPQLNREKLIIDVDKLREEWEALDTYQEKLAMMLKWTNITTLVNKGTKENPNWVRHISSAMQKRSGDRSAMFSGDLDIANQLETVLVRIAGMDFTTTEGMVEALGKLKEIAEKEGPEAKNILSQAISGLEAEIGVRLKKESDKKLNDEIEALFDQYELTLDLKKLNLPKGLAEDLFNTEYLDLEGLRKAVTDRASEFIGTEQEEEYKKFLEKIDEMERKAIVERTKTYAEYLKRGMNDRIKLKVEELRRLKELEESKEFTPDQKKEIRAQIQADSSKALDKAKWEQFQGTELYTMMFEDLETLGTKSIENLYEHLDKLRLNLSHLDASEVKEIVNQMEKLQEEMISRNPFKAFRDARKDIKAVGEDEQTLIDRLFSKEKIEAEAQAMIDSISTIERAFADGTFEQLRDEDKELFHSFIPQYAEEKDLASIKKEYQDVLDSAKEGKELTADQLKNFADYRQSLQGISDYWGQMNSKVQDIVGSAKEVMEVFGADEVAMAAADAVGNFSTLITQAVQFGIQMQIVGYESNMALGVIGWIAMGIQAIATIITSIANIQNARIDAQLEDQAAIIERQRDLYEQIEEKVDKAYSVDQLRQYNDEMKRSVELEIQALEASIALEKSRKNADEDQIADWQKEIDEARKRLEESTQEMKEMVGGIFDLEDFTSGFVDAWWDAMEEGMDGLDALNDHFEDTMKDLVKKQALYKGAQKIMEQVMNAINADLEGDYDIDDWAEIERIAKKANIDLDAFLQGYKDILGSITSGEGSGLSALEKGVQGMTTEQAEVLSAYWNASRQSLSNIDSKMDIILANMGLSSSDENPMLSQLRSQTDLLKAIKSTITGAMFESGALWVKLAKQ